ncbi:MAG: hypothetical protein F4X87_07675 [Chloroflexi bacterium]|nr:hypothetical protein [Chloroflexota bacterium]
MRKKQIDELTNKLSELWHCRTKGKISESRMRREMMKLLEAHTDNTTAQNRRVINDFVKTAHATRDLEKSFKNLEITFRI